MPCFASSAAASAAVAPSCAVFAAPGSVCFARDGEFFSAARMQLVDLAAFSLASIGVSCGTERIWFKLSYKSALLSRELSLLPIFLNSKSSCFVILSFEKYFRDLSLVDMEDFDDCLPLTYQVTTDGREDQIGKQGCVEWSTVDLRAVDMSKSGIFRLIGGMSRGLPVGL